MVKDWTFGRILAVGYTLAGIVLGVVAWFGFQSTASLIENNKDVAHTHEVRRELAMMLTQLVNVETGVRGFAITGQDAYLEPFESGVTGQAFGPAAAVVLGGAATIGVAAAWWRWFPALRDVDGFPDR